MVNIPHCIKKMVNDHGDYRKTAYFVHGMNPFAIGLYRASQSITCFKLFCKFMYLVL